MDGIIRKQNNEMLARVAAYITNTPRAIRAEDVRLLAEDCGLTAEEAYRILLAVMLSLDISLPDDRRLYENYLRPSVRLLDPAPFLCDPYAALLAGVRAEGGRITLEKVRIEAMELFPAGCMEKTPAGRVLQPMGFFETAYEYPSLRDSGREWMSLHPNETATVLPHARAAAGNVLCLGLGLGYYAYHASLSGEVESILIVERDREILDLFTRLLLPGFPFREKLRFYCGDAFDYLRMTRPASRFDTVYADLWHDVSDGLPLYRKLKALEEPGPRYHYWIGDTMDRYLEGDL